MPGLIHQAPRPQDNDKPASGPVPRRHGRCRPARVASALGRDRPLYMQTKSMLGPAQPGASARAWQLQVTVAVTGTVAVVHSPPIQTPQTSRSLDQRQLRVGPRLVAPMIRLMAAGR